MCIVGNPIILPCQIISFLPKKEKENGIMEFLNKFIYIYIYIFKKSTLVEDYFTSQTKVFQGCETLPSLVQKKKKKFVKLGQYVRRG